MPTTTATRRRSPRHAVVLDHDAFVEFDPSGPGEKLRLPLSDLSHSGLSFHGERGEMPPVESGGTIANVSLRIRECIIQGDLVVMHVTPRPDSRILCGALLYPATDHDLLKLKAVLAGMEAVQTP
jgi:hypothetical protein